MKKNNTCEGCGRKRRLWQLYFRSNNGEKMKTVPTCSWKCARICIDRDFGGENRSYMNDLQHVLASSGKIEWP